MKKVILGSLPLIKLNTLNKFDINCLLESFLNSSILAENSNLKINGYNGEGWWYHVERSVVHYIRKSLRVRNFSNLYLSECLTLEVTINNEKG